ncbi:MAG: c-type cytochrome [Candidatus Binataceae bacterium]
MRTNKLSAVFLSATVAASVASFVATFARAQDAAATYSQSCAACHGDKGKGDGAAGKYLKPPPPDFAVSLKGKSDDWIATAISRGGPAVGESATMPGFKQLSADQVKALVDYIKKIGS